MLRFIIKQRWACKPVGFIQALALLKGLLLKRPGFALPSAGLILSCVLCLGLGACTVQRSSSFTAPVQSAGEYLNLADQATGSAAVDYRLQALAVQLQQQRLQAAAALLTQLKATMLTPAQGAQLRLYDARLALLTGRSSEANKLLLGLVEPASLSSLSQLQRYQLQLWLGQSYWQLRQLAAGLQHLDQALTLLPVSAKLQRQQLQQRIWDALLAASASDLQAARRDAKNSWTERGWLQLIQIARQPMPWAQFLQQLQIWQRQFHQHPAAMLVNKRLTSGAQVIPQPLQHVAVILPVEGPYVASATAVKRGILAAYYQASQSGRQVPQLNFIDIDHGEVVAAYQQAVRQGAQVVIGPLAKPSIRKLLRGTQLSVPTLVLNQLASTSSSPMLYQFALSPRDEIKQLVLRAWQQGHRRALVVVPDNSWGQAMEQSFQRQWQPLGGQIVAQIKVVSGRYLASQVMRALEVKQSTDRSRALAAQLGEKLRYVPRRRQDFDMVFLMVSPPLARQVQPLLKYYYAGDVPIYATSIVYAGTINPRQDQDLNGIVFPDMPWVLLPADQLSPALRTIRQQARRNWPRLYAEQSRLFALGVDSFDVLQQLNRLNLLRQMDLAAATGTLSLTENNTFYRRLLWGRFERGRVRLVSNDA